MTQLTNAAAAIMHVARVSDDIIGAAMNGHFIPAFASRRVPAQLQIRPCGTVSQAPGKL
jgi:hypothetical protein